MTGPVAFGAEISEDRQHCAIVAAWRDDQRRMVPEEVWYAHPAGAVDRIEQLWVRHEPVAVVVDDRAPGATLVAPLAERGIVTVQPSAADLAMATGEFMDLVTQHKLRQLGQPGLTAAVRAAVQRMLAGGRAWDRRGAEQALLVAGTLACWALSRWEAMSSPGVYVIEAPGSRDIPPWVRGDAAWNASVPPWDQRL